MHGESPIGNVAGGRVEVAGNRQGFAGSPGETKTRMARRMERWIFGDFVLDLETRELVRAGRPVSLSPTAFQLLGILVEDAAGISARPATST